MHDHEIKITMVDAQQHERDFDFEEPQLCIVGRARDCDIPMPEGDENLSISRHHCLLEIDPPTVRVHDLGSTNGTYVNGVKIPRGRAKQEQRNGIALRDGDEVAVGPVRLRVHVPEESAGDNQADFGLEFSELKSGQPNADIAGHTMVGKKSRSGPNEQPTSPSEAQSENARK